MRSTTTSTRGNGSTPTSLPEDTIAPGPELDSEPKLIAEPGNIFADLKSLRRRTKTIDVSEHADIVDYRKPKRQEFFRIFPDPEMSIEADVFTDENDDDA